MKAAICTREAFNESHSIRGPEIVSLREKSRASGFPLVRVDGRDDLREKCGESETRLRSRLEITERLHLMDRIPEPPNVLSSILNFNGNFALIILLDSQNYVIPHMCTLVLFGH